MKIAGPPLTIEVDHRERDGRTAAALLHGGARVVPATLRTGDFRVDAALVVERKTAGDFVQSVYDGRLFRQASRLVILAPRPLLIVENLDPAAAAPPVRGAFVTLTAVFGLPVLRSTGPDDTARWILAAGRQFVARREDAVRRPGWRPRGKRARQIFVLQGLPGVGSARAAALLDRFGTVRAALSADEAALRGVPGIGTKVAKRIAWLAN